VLDWFNTLQAKDLALVMTALYYIWLTRNDARDEPMIEDSERTARRVLAITEEWWKWKTPSPSRHSTGVKHWLLPEPGWYKANADGALSAADGHGGGGDLARPCMCAY
jgi:hypothetical protein